MSVNNPWQTPFQRSYESIKGKLINEMRGRFPEMTDYTEGNIFVILISMFAAIAEVLHYYIDNMAREAFLPTARRYSSVVKHAKLVDYHIKSAIPATVDVILTLSNGNALSGNDIIIPVGTQFSSTDGLSWLSTKTVIFRQGEYSVKVPLIQQDRSGDGVELGTITSKSQITIQIPKSATNQPYSEGSMVLTIDNEPWTLVETFAYASSTDKVYKVEVGNDGESYIVFGDGKFGMIPSLGGVLKGTFYYTDGSAGNIDAGNFTTVPSELSSLNPDLIITQPIAATGGSDYENFNMLKEHIPLSLKTLGVAITKDDYESITRLVPGVDKAYVTVDCGNKVSIYITPDNGGVASSALRDIVYRYIQKYKVITVNVEVLSTYPTQIFLDAHITGKKSFKSLDISNQVKNALLNKYNYENSTINQTVYISEVYQTIENVNLVENVTIDKLYLLSYPKPLVRVDQPELNINRFVQNSYTSDQPEIPLWIVIDDEDPTMYKVTSPYSEVYAEGTIGTPTQITIEDSLDAEITINPIAESGGNYTPGDIYQVTVTPMNTNIGVIDYNIPIISAQNINLTIDEVV